MEISSLALYTACLLTVGGIQSTWVFRYNPELEWQFSEGVFSVKLRSMIIITLQS